MEETWELSGSDYAMSKLRFQCHIYGMHESLLEKNMKMTDIPFDTTDWTTIERTEHKGETGMAYWRAISAAFGFAWLNIRPGSWRIIGVSRGTFLEDGRIFILKPGMRYQVANNAEAHRRSSTAVGARLFVDDGRG